MAQHIVITASGTGVSMWDTTPPQPAAVAIALDQTLCYWQPLGNYPASVTNPQMGRSVQEGVDEIVRLINDVYPPGNPRGTSFILLGYSQGAIVVSHFVRDELLSPTGRCSGRAGDLVAVGVWGNPCRLPGWASGNQYAGWPMPADLDGVVTGGIAGPDCLQPQHVVPHLATPVTHFWGEWVNTTASATTCTPTRPSGRRRAAPRDWTFDVRPAAGQRAARRHLRDADLQHRAAVVAQRHRHRFGHFQDLRPGPVRTTHGHRRGDHQRRHVRRRRTQCEPLHL
jgi:hypothetical protein